jgi:hypothetical protein
VLAKGYYINLVLSNISKGWYLTRLVKIGILQASPGNTFSGLSEREE